MPKIMDRKMEQKAKASKDHFENTEVYLGKDFDVRLRCEIISENLNSAKGLNILDLGCGNGLLSLQFQKEAESICLVDVTENMLEIAKSNVLPEYKDKITFIQSDLDSFMATEPFDIVIASGILAHVPNVNSAIQKINTCLKPNGICFTQITDSKQVLSKLNLTYNNLLDWAFNNFTYKRNIFSHSEIMELFQKNNFSLVMEKQYSLILPLMKTLFSDSFLYRYSKFTTKQNLLSSLGSDFIIKLKKN